MAEKNLLNQRRLHEFICLWSKTEWNKIQKLESSGYLKRLRGHEKGYLSSLVDSLGKFKKKSTISIQIFNSITGKTITRSEWSHFTTELIKICEAHTRFSLLDTDSQMYTEISRLEYYRDNELYSNHDYLRKDFIESRLPNYRPEKSMEGFLRAYFQEIIHRDNRRKSNREKLLSLHEWVNNVDLYYHEMKLRLVGLMLNRRDIQKKLEYHWLEDDYMNEIPENLDNLQQIKLHKDYLLLIKNQSDQQYQQLKTTLLEIVQNKNNQLHKEYMVPFFIRLANYCIAKVKDGNHDFYQEFIDINTVAIETGITLENNKITCLLFRNLTISYLKLDQYEEAVAFNKKFEYRLNGNSSDAYRYYCSALLDYMNDNEDKNDRCREKLSQIAPLKNLDLFLKFNTKFLAILSYMSGRNFEMESREIENLKLMLERSREKKHPAFKTWESTYQLLDEINKASTEGMNRINKLNEIKQEIPSKKNIKNDFLIIRAIDKKIARW